MTIDSILDPYCFLVLSTHWIFTFIILVCLSNSHLNKKKLLKFGVSLEILPNQWELNFNMKFCPQPTPLEFAEQFQLLVFMHGNH